MAGGEDVVDHETWRACLEASYFNIPQGECRTCNNGNSKCGSYFCVGCKVGGLCKATFNAGGDHAQHPCIRVWMVTGAYAVWVDDLREFMPPAKVDQIQLFSENLRLNCKLRKSNRHGARRPKSSRRRICRGCGHPISVTMNPNLSDSPVCSLECLLDHALGTAPQRPRQRRPRQRRRKQNTESVVRIEPPADDHIEIILPEVDSEDSAGGQNY